jgi:multiple sugar transport system substrate-binding protein
MQRVGHNERMPPAPRREIDPREPIPIYVQLKTLLLEDIVRGRYGSDGQLPTEHELCAMHRISRTPVHRALSELAAEAVILRHRRRGSFVNPHWLRRNPSGPELRVVVPEGPWAELLQRAAPAEARLNVAEVHLPDLHQVLVHAVAEGIGPDLAVLDSVWVREFAAAGFLQPLDELDPAWVAGEYRQDFLAPFVDANSYRGQAVAVQAEADVAGLWFRRDVLRAAGSSVPADWSALREAARAVSRVFEGAPLVLPGGSRGGEATTYCLLALLASNGVEVLGESAVTIGSAGTVECLRFLRGLIDDGLVPEDVVTFEWDRSIRLLAHGSAALCIGGSYERRALAAAGIGEAELERQFGFAPLPAGPRGTIGTLAGGMVHAIFRQAKNPELAMSLLRRVVSPSSLADMSRRTDQLPSRRAALALAAESSAFLADTAALLHHAVVRPSTAAYARVSAQLQVMLESVVVGRRSPEDAAARAADTIAAITGSPTSAAARP